MKYTQYRKHLYQSPPWINASMMEIKRPTLKQIPKKKLDTTQTLGCPIIKTFVPAEYECASNGCVLLDGTWVLTVCWLLFVPLWLTPLHSPATNDSGCPLHNRARASMTQGLTTEPSNSLTPTPAMGTRTHTQIALKTALTWPLSSPS